MNVNYHQALSGLALWTQTAKQTALAYSVYRSELEEKRLGPTIMTRANPRPEPHKAIPILVV